MVKDYLCREPQNFWFWLLTVTCWILAKELKSALCMTWYAVPDGSNEKREFEVFNFTGAGGVALSMYNTDEVQTWPHPLNTKFCYWHEWVARKILTAIFMS